MSKPIKTIVWLIAVAAFCLLPVLAAFAGETINLNGQTVTWDARQLSDVSIVGPGTITTSPGAIRCAIAGDNVTFREVTFATDGTFSNGSSGPSCDVYLSEGATNIRFLQCRFVGKNYAAISCDVDCSTAADLTYSTPVENVLIDDCEFGGDYSRQLYLFSLRGLTVRHSYFHDSRYDAIRLRLNCEDVIIDGNRFVNVGLTGDPTQTRDAIDTAHSGQRLTIINNSVFNCGCVGFDIKGRNAGENGTGRLVIANNRIEQTVSDGIVVTAHTAALVESVIISGNIIDSCGRGVESSAGILIKGGTDKVKIADNLITRTRGRGINVISANGPNTNLSVTGNVITETQAPFADLATTGADSTAVIVNNLEGTP